MSHLQPLTNGHFQFLIIVELAAFQMFLWLSIHLCAVFFWLDALSCRSIRWHWISLEEICFAYKKMDHTTNLFAGWCFQYQCHCTSTYPYD